MWELHEYKTRDALLIKLTATLSRSVSDCVAQRGKASIALSGGSTPGGLYRQLAQQALPWQCVTVSLVDERWVDDIHPQSNARFIRHNLLDNGAGRANFIGMKTSHPDAFTAADALSGILARHILPLDIVLLGMGLDGHTASFFPHAQGLAQALASDCRQVCCAIQPGPSADESAPLARMTLSLNTILSAHQRILYITGEAKRQALEKALVPGSTMDMPVRAVLHDNSTMTEIYYAPDD